MTRPSLPSRRFICGVLMLALAMSAAASDLVIRTDGRKQRGKLKSCIGSRCQLDAQSIPRESIAWIGLEAKASFPPAVTNAYMDEVHLADGSVEVASIIGISLGEIVTEKSNFVRKDVAWIHLVPPNKSNEPVIDDSGETPANPAPAPSPSPTTPKPKQPKPQPQPQPRPRPAPKPQNNPNKSGVTKPCPADNPMGGLVMFDADYNRGRKGCRETVHTVLRFPLVRFWHLPAGTPWARQVALDFNESKIDWEVSTTGCSETNPTSQEECHEPAMHQSGTWVRTPIETTLPVIRFSAVKPRLDATSLPRDIAAPFTVPFDCQGPRSGGHSSHIEGLGGFSVHELTNVACTNNEGFVFCVPPPGECVEPTGLPNDECVLHADRHAIFPFSGDASWHSTNANEELVDTKIRWDICCGCATKAAPPEPSNDPCGDMSVADGLVQKNRDERDAKTAEVEEEWNEYKSEMAEAQSHSDDFKKTIDQCRIQERVTKVLILTASLFAPGGAAVEGAEAEEAIAEAAKELGKIVGDPGVTLAEVIEKIMANEDPTSSALPNELFQNFRKAGEEAQNILDYLTKANLPQLEERIEQCAGTINLSYDTWHGAQQYVEKLKEAMGRIPDIQKNVNDIRQLDTDYPDLQYKSWAACVQHARCAGTPEDACDAKKPAGDWPPVPR